MDRRDFLRCAAAAGLAGAARAAEPERPNIVLLVAGNWRAVPGPNPDEAAVWPNVARLSREGVRFDRAYTTSPSLDPADAARPALLAGKFPHALAPGDPTISEALRGVGYRVVDSTDALRRDARPFFLNLSWDDPRGPYGPEQWEGYYEACSSVDARIESILLALDREALADSTLVVFTSLRGELLSAHRAEGARRYFEEAARVPLVMRYPKALKPATPEDRWREVPPSTYLVSHADLAPTLLSLCGAPIPPGVQGRDLKRLIFEGEGDQPDSVYCYGDLGTPVEFRMIVRGWEKLVVDRNEQPVALFNLRSDPYETDNLLANDSGARRTRDSLLANLLEWRKRIGDGYEPAGLRTRPALNQ
jgi:arylsulfatase A-like enzyme